MLLLELLNINSNMELIIFTIVLIIVFKTINYKYGDK